MAHSAALSAAPSHVPSGALAPLDAVWRASELAQSPQPTVGSGFAPLDAQLPNAGWPTGALIEILQTQAGSHEWRLLLPALRVCSPLGRIALVGSPHLPNLAALSCMGIAASSVVLVEAGQPAQRLWAAEQVLRCREVAALLVWLPQARSEQLRRLHLASASQANGKPRLVFAFRPAQAAQESSAAPLRLRLTSGAQHQLDVEIIKRKGPALDTTLHLAAQLPAVLALRSGVHSDMPSAPERPCTPVYAPVQPPVHAPVRAPVPELCVTPGAGTAAWALDTNHAVDRTAKPRRSRKHPALAVA
jgi:protein ImuA